MRLPRFRFSLRWVMVAVAVAGVVFWLLKRRESFQVLAHQYAIIANSDTCNVPPLLGTDAFHRWEEGQELDRQGRESYVRLSLKYERAARYPWLPVTPDRPAPFRLLPDDWRESLFSDGDP